MTAQEMLTEVNNAIYAASRLAPAAGEIKPIILSNTFPTYFPPISGQILRRSNRPKSPYAICVGGQSYKIGSRQLNRADLNTLYKIKNDLMAQVAGSTPGFLDDCYCPDHAVCHIAVSL